MLKTCPSCKENLPLDSFNRNKSTKDGLCSTCRKCSKQRSVLWYSLNREKAITRAVEWNNSNQERRREIKKKWDTSHAEQKRRICADYVKNNPLKVKLKNERWRKINKVKDTLNKMKWADVNVEKVKQARDKWRTKNPDRWMIDTHARRARTRGRFTQQRVNQLKQDQGNKCVYCPADLTKFHIDHIMPLALGGSNMDDNIQLLCPRCNLKKHAKHPDVFAREIARARTA